MAAASQSNPPPERLDVSSVRSWSDPPPSELDQMEQGVTLDLGWGRLIFGQTFTDQQELVNTVCQEKPGERDIVFYLRDPHVLLSLAPDRLFLDPSHTYRLWPDHYQSKDDRPEPSFAIRPVQSERRAKDLRRMYMEWHMVSPRPDEILAVNDGGVGTYFVVVDDQGTTLGGVLGVDHTAAFKDPEGGASLWCLAVGRDCQVPGVGEALVRYIVEHYFDKGRNYVDLSVLHNNTEAIALYEKLGFRRVPVFCVKHKNQINETYFVRETGTEVLNPYAQIIVEEARRRGIYVTVLDAEYGLFRLHFAGHSVTCRESLSELTSAVAMTRCDDKRLTRRVLDGAGLKVPAQSVAVDDEEDEAFLEAHEQIVVKPARGEQGTGVTVDVRDPAAMRDAIALARRSSAQVLLEELVEGDDLRIIVINEEVVAAAVRRPAMITGAQGRTVHELIKRYNRRRKAATGGESAVPLDEDTRRCVEAAGYAMDDVLDDGQTIRVRKTANLHTGGTIDDVTEQLHPDLADAAVKAARALDIPVVGLDFMVPDVTDNRHVIIEANERPGLANHEPQPTAERFIDLLFPQTTRRTGP
jgi:GNAT-family acetyltransferase (TIGR03103 family)